MRRRITRFGFVSLLVMCWLLAPASYAQTDSEVAARFVGGWELVGSESRQADGSWMPVENSGPPERIGIIMYSESGHMSVHIMRRDRGATGGYTAYFGTYHVNAREGFLIHRRAGHLSPNSVGTDAKRFYTFSDTDLTLSGDPSRSRLRWRRVE